MRIFNGKLKATVFQSRHARSDWYAGSVGSRSGHSARRPDRNGRIGVKRLDDDLARTAQLCSLDRFSRFRVGLPLTSGYLSDCQPIVRQVEGGGRTGNKPVDGQRINTYVHLAMQVQAAQHRFGPLGVAPPVSFLSIDANLIEIED